MKELLSLLFGLELASCTVGGLPPRSTRIPEKPMLQRNKGAKAPPAPKPIKAKDLPQVAPSAQIPPPAPIPPTPPPPTQTSIAADQSMADTQRQELRKKGMRQTLLAGETNAGAGKKTLLG